MPPSALRWTLAAALLAAAAVAHQRIGLAVTLTLAAVLVAGALAARGPVDRPALALAGVLSLGPLVRDAGWVVALDTAAALVAGAAAVVAPRRWGAVARATLTPLRLLGGGRLVAAAARRTVPDTPRKQWIAVGRGVGLAVVLVACFGGLFASADPAFAESAGTLLDVGGDPWGPAWRATLGIAVASSAGALAVAGGAAHQVGPARRPRLLLGRTELVIALGALVLLFAAFVVVQLPVLFGGEEHVRTTSGLGYGDYARDGFLQLLVVAGLTLAVVAIAARTPDRPVRLLLGALCLLTLVVLWSAHGRLVLVEDAYGLTRVRLGGHALLVWLALVLLLVLAAGARPAIARRAPRAAVFLTLAAVVAFSAINPDGRIGDAVAARVADGRPVDRAYVGGLSADALHALWRIPRSDGGASLWSPIERRLERGDGVAGFNVSRWAAR